jgi:hypothetical protein
LLSQKGDLEGAREARETLARMTPQTINNCFAIVTREVEEVQAALRAERAVREDFADFQRKCKEEEHVYLQSIILASADRNKAMALTIAKLRACLTPDELLPIVKPLDNIQLLISFQ